MTQFLTLSNENQFTFTCPVFDQETRMSHCMRLRERVWMGKHEEKRQGCQAAMRCGMCPAAEIVNTFSYSHGKKMSDDYGSTTPTKGRLHAKILERIKNVVPVWNQLQSFDLSPAVRELLSTARSRIEAQLKSAPGANAPFVEPRKSNRFDPINKRQPPSIVTKIEQAALTGDMSVAISEAA